MTNIEIIQTIAEFLPYLLIVILFFMVNRVAHLLTLIREMGDLYVKGLTILKRLMISEEERVYGTNSEQDFLAKAVEQLFNDIKGEKDES